MRHFFYLDIVAKLLGDETIVLSTNENLPMTRVHLTKEHVWFFLNRELLITSAFIFVVYNSKYRYYRKWCSSWMKSWRPFDNEHQLLSLVSMGNCKVLVLPENWNLVFSIWWNNRNHFDGVFMEYLSGIQPHVYFWKSCFQILKSHKKHKMHVQQLLHSYRVSRTDLLL